MPVINIVVWNSQGDKWNHFGNHLYDRNRDSLGLLAESGWAPWITFNRVVCRSVYNSDEFQVTRANLNAVGVHDRTLKLNWIPWVRNPDAVRTNSRCSLGVFRNSNLFAPPMVYNSDRGERERPYVCVVSREYMFQLRVYLLHLPSGITNLALNRMESLRATMNQYGVGNTPALIVGDMNIDIINTQINYNGHWELLALRDPAGNLQATQQSGGALDWGVLYNPGNQITRHNVQEVQRFRPRGHVWQTHQSDHSCLRYRLECPGN